ncbi:hypothetical protein TMatcc_010706 [Talaromyces marneffei ATCC 18224]|uniref:Uncharacterized protein n=1 Tax=Talaromyces marneffei (strain ATCC 18224 / CBS 334.59 / QM 7333) TaxID=441960 RepID=B6QUU6_TALMQ|nr:uncharacterized protein EYB26_009531 [Talaromyces marneffei]EEA18751.1 conserved hypothetical protein [Talaromyces marneffei ATCC 18224]KAE8548475.1 hypothetical protein EYB25_008853 [Talaromyces marneffei]QGA21820.1 hypothetical protein EYB26_009531 [Talaromyces marneffei]
MAGDDPFAFLATQEPPKPLQSSKSVRRLNWGGREKTEKPEKTEKTAGDQKSKWREKLFSKDRDAKQVVATERQLDDFLGYNRPRPIPESPIVVSAVADPTFESGSPQRRDLSTPPSPPKQYVALSPQSSTQASPPKPKPRRRKGLRVTFTDLPPEVMGEGGDESEEPTVEISRKKGRPTKDDPKSQIDDGYEDLQDRRPTLPELHLDTSFAGSAAPSAQPDKPLAWKPLLISPQDQDFLLALNSGEPGSRLSFRASPDSKSFARRIHARMQEEEGLALQHRLQQEDPTSPTEVDDEAKPRQQEALPTHPSFTSQRSQLSQQSLNVDVAAPTLSLRTSPVPAVHDQVKALRRDDIPEILSPGGSSASSLSPTTDEPKHAFPPPEASRPQPTGPPPQYQASPTTRVATEPPKPPAAASAPRSAKMTLRSVANAMGDTAYQEFTAYVERFNSLYGLTAENVKPLMETSFAEWIRASTWWFLRGRSGLESAVRSGRNPDATEAMQAVVDLGKAWWISTQIVPKHPELTCYGRMSIDALVAVASTAGDHRMAGLVNLHQKIMNHLRALTVSMKRNQILSAIGSTEVNDHPIDTNIWVRYPFFAPDVAAAVSGSNRRSMLIDSSSQLANTPEMMLVGDTSRYFSYGTMFVEVSLTSDDDDDTSQYAIQCVLSIRRDRSDSYVLAALSSQSELVNILIQTERKNGPTWDDVQWQVKARTMTVKLRRGFELNVAFTEKDFKMLWNIVQYTLKTEASLNPEAGERRIFQDTLKMFQYMDSGTPKTFPSEPSPLCRMALFEKTVTWTEGTGTRKAHRGFRLAVVTNPQTKTLSSVQHTLGYGAPIVFGYLRGENGSPALLLKLKEDSRPRSMVLTFDRIEQRTLMHSLLLGMLANENETTCPNLPTRSFSIEEARDPVTGGPGMSHLKFNAGSVSVIDLDSSYPYLDRSYGQQVLSESLRALISTEWGTVTDRINLGPGEMKIGLDPNSNTTFTMYRARQEDMTVAIAENLVEKELPDSLTQFLEASKTKPTIRRFEFSSVEDLHKFQEMMTGFRVVFDSTVTSFAIARRRMVVPIHKKWEASGVRLQLVVQNKTIQLLAFFGGDFSHGKCMNFLLRGTDNYESSSRSGKCTVRIVDAKFALPKKDEEEASAFVCLDMLEYATEHDDITIVFESEQDRSKFLTCLPGSTREPARMASMRR